MSHFSKSFKVMRPVMWLRVYLLITTSSALYSPSPSLLHLCCCTYSTWTKIASLLGPKTYCYYVRAIKIGPREFGTAQMHHYFSLCVPKLSHFGQRECMSPLRDTILRDPVMQPAPELGHSYSHICHAFRGREWLFTQYCNTSTQPLGGRHDNH